MPRTSPDLYMQVHTPLRSLELALAGDQKCAMMVFPFPHFYVIIWGRAFSEPTDIPNTITANRVTITKGPLSKQEPLFDKPATTKNIIEAINWCEEQEAQFKG